MQSEILAPVTALLAWSMVMWVWMYATRLPAMLALGKEHMARLGQKPGDLDTALPASIQWKAHNYNHLMEQPTLFYAAALTLALLGAGSGLNLLLAWGYVGLRIAHSLVQALVNIVPLRFALFASASLLLMAMIVRAALLAFHLG